MGQVARGEAPHAAPEQLPREGQRLEPAKPWRDAPPLPPPPARACLDGALRCCRPAGVLQPMPAATLASPALIFWAVPLAPTVQVWGVVDEWRTADIIVSQQYK